MYHVCVHMSLKLSQCMIGGNAQVKQLLERGYNVRSA
jgi:hypothetical protein